MLPGEDFTGATDVFRSGHMMSTTVTENALRMTVSVNEHRCVADQAFPTSTHRKRQVEVLGKGT